ncbi:ATP-binding protein [Conexibacter woesei]|uniref:ATP-binding protein n=1 Tax=Conexibacter woesei TaxID=191495 RepID=UPI000407C5ED|nr:AAA family ATPase [Conexibacter woesei]
MSAPESRQRPPAEELHAEELARLVALDADVQRPPGWRMTPASAVRFIAGDAKLGIAPKFVGERAFVERCVVALATNRGLMLIGRPGTAKSLLSELLAAAVSGDSTLTIQGSAATTDDAIKYSWNYALLLAEGPSERSLVPAPLHTGMREGRIVRFEEITRCPIEVQDALLSVLSDRVLVVPELDDEQRTVFAAHGFNLIATANTRDRGTNEMSAALKRRFNFETVLPIADLQDEMALVQRETAQMLARVGIAARLDDDLTEVLVTTFAELRTGRTAGDKAIEPLASAMSTAEAVSVGYAACVQAHYFGGGRAAGAGDVAQHLIGTAIKDDPDDVKKLRHYVEQEVRGRKGKAWKDLYAARGHLR